MGWTTLTRCHMPTDAIATDFDVMEKRSGAGLHLSRVTGGSPESG
ncbi:hypothetical protein RZS08_21335 [Arthrospira platensis SPKY1]|nr:hypothetical protein [Arthrospira platensis SPKY1]